MRLDPERTFFLGLKWSDADVEKIKSFFSNYGVVTEIIIPDMFKIHNEYDRTYAFVEMSTEQEAKTVLKANMPYIYQVKPYYRRKIENFVLHEIIPGIMAQNNTEFVYSGTNIVKARIELCSIDNRGNLIFTLNDPSIDKFWFWVCATMLVRAKAGPHEIMKEFCFLYDGDKHYYLTYGKNNIVNDNAVSANYDIVFTNADLEFLRNLPRLGLNI